ncbi:MAG: hypothetical protein ACRCW5_09110 [Cetobacterium sp.]|uniref:hypothetical protein n=1 Tax=Cetobacterium sp. TaxID=2071632 RepID=UPI003F2B688C
MRKYIISILVMINSLSSFSFQMDKTNFDEVVLRDAIKSKNYTILNNSEDTKEYMVNIENDISNITVKPSKFVLKPNEEKIIQLSVEGRGKKGENSYFLVFSERNLSAQKENKVVINKKIRIKQKYIM